jgi:WhiB family redox-sensing transcriptional regulator
VTGGTVAIPKASNSELLSDAVHERSTGFGRAQMPKGDWMIGWQFRAACRGEESALFFAPGYFERKEQKDAREGQAKRICAGCPVREECLDYALRIREPHGIWGGLNEMERRALLRSRQRAG